jgi:hypothetical protein
MMTLLLSACNHPRLLDLNSKNAGQWHRCLLMPTPSQHKTRGTPNDQLADHWACCSPHGCRCSPPLRQTRRQGFVWCAGLLAYRVWESIQATLPGVTQLSAPVGMIEVNITPESGELPIQCYEFEDAVPACTWRTSISRLLPRPMASKTGYTDAGRPRATPAHKAMGAMGWDR